jgi:hypothetical protein
MRCTYFFNSKDKVGVNFIKNSCVSHMLLKKGYVSFLLTRLKEIPLTQFGEKFCSKLIMKMNKVPFIFTNGPKYPFV